MRPDLTSGPLNGRLFVVVSQTSSPEPRRAMTKYGSGAPGTLARDVSGFAPGTTMTVDQIAFSYPSTVAPLSPGDYYVQPVFHPDPRTSESQGELYGQARKIHLDPDSTETVLLELSQPGPPEVCPSDTEQMKFIKIPSPMLSQFHGRPMYLRAGVLLPRDYDRETSRSYPLWVRIGGLNARYTGVVSLMGEKSDFRKVWLADDTPRFIMLQLDGTGPYGDPYWVNSANNGPYGDALVRELIPYVEHVFRCAANGNARVLSGSSTGGWGTLALQIFYPDFFNGTWSASPDPVDFRAFEVVNIYQDDNMYVNSHGYERPSERNKSGDITLTVRDEVAPENLLGSGNSYTMSNGQWGAWNAAFGPRGADGRPAPLWDPQSGKIDHAVAEKWKKFDLTEVLQKNWPTLAPKLRGKLHITTGESDAYYLNSAVHLMDEFLSKATPAYEGSIIYGPGKGHGWSNLSLREMLVQMEAATKTACPR